MAGIGFQLQKLILKGGASRLIRAYFYSSIIVAGPYLVLVLSIVLIKHLTTYFQLPINPSFFIGLLVYLYAFSSISSCTFYFILSRHLSNQYYLRNLIHFSTAYLKTLEKTFILSTPFCLLILSFLPLSFLTKLILFLLFLTLTGIWIAMCVLSAAKSYFWIMGAFIGGTLLSLSLSFSMAPSYHLEGMLYGYFIGQLFIFLLLSARIFWEFNFSWKEQFEFSYLISAHPYLLYLGILYGFSMWIDKFVFWFSPTAQIIENTVRLFPDYDVPLFWAYLSTLPSMCYFLSQMETGFVLRYWNFFECIENRKTLSEILEAKGLMNKQIIKHFQNILIYQGGFSLLLIFFAKLLSSYLHIAPHQVMIFRISLLGCFFQIINFVILNLFLYFDFHKQAFLMCLSLLITNFIFTLLSYHLGIASYGFGFTIAHLIVLTFAAIKLVSLLDEIEYWTFTRQPLETPRFKFEKEHKLTL